MLKKYLLYGICGCLLAFTGCNDDEEEVTTPSYADQNWFVIPDKPGEFNQLVYNIYQDHGRLRLRPVSEYHSPDPAAMQWTWKDC